MALWYQAISSTTNHWTIQQTGTMGRTKRREEKGEEKAQKRKRRRKARTDGRSIDSFSGVWLTGVVVSSDSESSEDEVQVTKEGMNVAEVCDKPIF